MVSRHAASWLISASFLVLGACSPKNKTSDGPKPVTEQWIIANIDTDFAPRDISLEEAQKALEALSLWEVNDELKWESRKGDGGNYIFSNITSDKTDLKIESLDIQGLRMLNEETPYADQFAISGLSLSVPEDNLVFNADTITMSLPDAEELVEAFNSDQSTAQAFDSEALQNLFLNDNLNFSLGEGVIDNLTVQADGVDFTMDFVGWAENEDTRRVSLLMKDINGSAAEADKDPITFNLDMVSMEGLDLEYYDRVFSNDIAGMNPFDPTAQSVIVENMDMKGDGFFLSLPKFVSWYTDKKDGVFHGISNMPSLTFGFNEVPEDPEFAEMKENLSKLGYESMEFSMESRTLLDETNDLVDIEIGRLSMTDGFDMNFDYKISGLKSMMEKIDVLAKKEASEDEVQGLGLMGDPDLIPALNALSIQNLEWEFVDQSILERSFKMVAEEQDVSSDLVKQQAKGGVMMMTLGAKGEYQMELAQSFAQNMQKLIDEGGRFKVSMNPGEALKIGDMVQNMMGQQDVLMTGDDVEPSEPVSADEVLRSLNIQVEHSPE